MTVYNKLIKQIESCPKEGSISVAFSDICFCNIKADIAVHSKSLFYKRYVDDTYPSRIKNETDDVYSAINSHHQNMIT